MESKYLKIVSLIILTLAVGFFFLHYYYNDNDGLYINIGTELLGIVITVGFIDLILRMRYAREWKSVDVSIKKLVEEIKNNILFENFELLMVSTSEFINENESGEVFIHAKDQLKLLKTIDKNATFKKWSLVSESFYKNRFNSFKVIEKKIINIIDLFAYRLNPKIIEVLLELNIKCKEINQEINIFSPDDLEQHYTILLDKIKSLSYLCISLENNKIGIN